MTSYSSFSFCCWLCADGVGAAVLVVVSSRVVIFWDFALVAFVAFGLFFHVGFWSTGWFIEGFRFRAIFRKRERLLIEQPTI